MGSEGEACIEHLEALQGRCATAGEYTRLALILDSGEAVAVVPVRMSSDQSALLVGLPLPCLFSTERLFHLVRQRQL